MLISRKSKLLFLYMQKKSQHFKIYFNQNIKIANFYHKNKYIFLKKWPINEKLQRRRTLWLGLTLKKFFKMNW